MRFNQMRLCVDVNKIFY